MTYLGPARIENGRIVLPDGANLPASSATMEAIEVGGDILLSASSLDRARMERVRQAAADSIADHRDTLEGLAK
ncbi:MAG: hypothetical protein D6744_12315 [Planctomycetota bacterium]|nr:MAG: hypothetical protein D6744_12315 [Planctomycetota bacterium]